MAEPVAHDEAPSVINDHPFEPRGKWWSLCKHCGLAQAAHSSSTINSSIEMTREHLEAYGEVRYPRHPERARRLEEQFREYERKRVTASGRSRFAYVSDDEDD